MADQAPRKAGFVGYDSAGHFLHFCHCGAWANYGFGVDQLNGKLGQWYCAEHNPKRKTTDEK